MQLPKKFIENISIQINDTNRFTESLEGPSPISLRLNPIKKINRFDEMEKVVWHAEGRYLNERPVFTLDPSFHAGAYYVQEASSMFLNEVLKQCTDENAALKVLDSCAAPGGKSTLLASAISKDSILLSNEVIRKRVDPLIQNMTKWGHTNTLVSNHDPGDFAALNNFFDVVVVDAPCSGEGLFRKDLNARKEWSQDHVLHCSARQKRILNHAKGLVANGGVLIYSTCTYNFDENDGNISWLEKQGDFEVVKLNIPTEWNIKETKYGYQFYPHKLKGEGFYISALRNKKNDKKSFVKKTTVNDLKPVSKKELPMLKEWIESADRFSFFQKPNNEAVAIPTHLIEEFSLITNALKRRSMGLNMGVFKNKKFIPSHTLALSSAISPNLPSIEVDRRQALLFLKKEQFELKSDNKGWYLINYQGLNLGWVKMLGHRFNNYFPKEWRIRMELDI